MLPDGPKDLLRFGKLLETLHLNYLSIGGAADNRNRAFSMPRKCTATILQPRNWWT